MAFVASRYLAPIAAIQQRIRTKKATQLDSENFYIRSSAAPIGAAIYATRVRCAQLDRSIGRAAASY
jgi:hypothetical protein